MGLAGYMMHPDAQQYSCSICPFVCKSLTDMEFHRQHHKSGSGRPIRCPICPFFVTDKQYAKIFRVICDKC